MRAGQGWVYTPMDDLPELVDKAAKTLVVLGSAGFEVAGHHKQVMLALGDDLDEIASLAGLVSTVAVGENRLRVSDTDGDSFAEAWEETGVVLVGQRVLILGVGGALREGLGVRYRSRDLQVVFGGSRSSRGEGRGYNQRNLLGDKEEGPLPLPAGALAIDKIICDAVNKAKEETALIRQAKVAGAWTVGIAGWVVSGGASRAHW